MTNALQISAKLDDGKIVVVGGETVDQFADNLKALGGDDFRDEVRATCVAALLSAGVPTVSPGFGQATQTVQQSFPQAQPVQQQSAQSAPPGQPPMGSNGKPKRWVPPGVSKKTGKPYDGFWGEDRDR